jgi:hypothetical protein
MNVVEDIMSDYKYEMQMEAERIAQEEYASEFYDLKEDQRYDIFRRAETNWAEKKAAQAEDAYDRSRGF